jgi:2-methylisocitrate lyase-like PEP mutase family enzyme
MQRLIPPKGADQPLILPVVGDGLQARLAERAGFEALTVGGFPLAGSRLGMPDLALIGFGEMRDGVRDIMSAVKPGMPFLIDCDEGYGDGKNVARTVQAYEAMGVAAMLIEDQVSPKRCGHMAGKDVVSADVWLRKLKTALRARRNPATMIWARTDAREVHGLDDALRRAAAAASLGVDGVFVEAPRDRDELAQIGSHPALRDVPLLANMLEGGRTPLLEPRELSKLGFSVVVYPTSLVLRIARTIETTLAEMRQGLLTKPLEPEQAMSFTEYKSALRFDEWVAWGADDDAATASARAAAAHAAAGEPPAGPGGLQSSWRGFSAN